MYLLKTCNLLSIWSLLPCYEGENYHEEKEGEDCAYEKEVRHFANANCS